MPVAKDTVIERCARIGASYFNDPGKQAGTELFSSSSSVATARQPALSVADDGDKFLIWNIGGGVLAIDPAETETTECAPRLCLREDEWRWLSSSNCGRASVLEGGGAAMDNGKLNQIIHKKFDSFASGSSNHLRDDTRPHVTKMDPVPAFQQTITPTGPCDIHVHVTLQVSNSTSGWVLGGLFVDDNEEASAVAEGYVTTGTDDQSLSFWFKTTAADQAPLTFKIYMAASNGTWYLNGSTGGHRLFGGAWYSSMEILEVSE